MDVQDHQKTSTSVHENHSVHLCHKCGWPFPNPHPSAKHRRAHKKVCGTIEGYKPIGSESDHPHLAVSDDENISDEDQLATSPNLDKGGVKELDGRGSVGKRSNKSEIEAFSNAVTEFSDGGVSLGIEERLEKVKQLDKNFGKELVHDLNESQLTKDDRTAETAQSLTLPTESPQDPKRDAGMSDPEVVQGKIYQPQASKPISDFGFGGISTGVDKTNGLQSDSSPVISESILGSANINTNDGCGKSKELIYSGLERDIEGKENGNEVKLITGTVDTNAAAASERPRLESNFEGTQDQSPGLLLLESVLHETDGKTSDTLSEPKFQHQLEEVEGKASHAGKVDEVFGQVKEVTGELPAEMAKQDFSPGIEPSNCANASVIDEVQANSNLDLFVVSHCQLPVACDLGEDRNEGTHLLSMVETLPAIENPEIKNGDSKDYKVFKSSFPLDLEPTEPIRPVEDDNEVTVSEFHSSSLSIDPAGCLNNSPSDLNASEDDLQKDGVLPPCEGEVNTCGLRVASNEDFESNVLGVHPETQANHMLEGSQLQYVDDKSSRNKDTKPTTMKCSDAIPFAPPTSEETWETTNSNGGESADINGMDKTVYFAPENGKVDAGNELSEDNITTSGHAENSAELKNDQNTSSLPQDDSHFRVNAGIGIPDIAANGKIGGGGAERKLIKHEDRGLESIEHLPNPTNLNGVIVSDQAINPRDLESLKSSSSSQKCSGESCQEFSGGLDMGNNAEASLSSAAPGTISECNHEDPVASDMSSENLISKEIAALAVESELLSKSPVRVEDKNTIEAVISEKLQIEGDDKIGREELSVSAVDNSANSSGRTDSLEGNWGSVSVLSMRSDVTAVADTEVLSSTDSQLLKKLESNLLKPQAAAQEWRSDKAEVREAPSFMTLVESEGRVDKKAASETQTTQNTEQPKADASLQAGWFPSMSNVVNESEGRKKNEEIIAKVTNWTTGKQHGPLKNLLSEAHSETKTKSPNAELVPVVNQADGTALKNNGTAVTTVSLIMGSETPSHAAKKDVDKEWNSPARYPIEIKKEKRKAKPYWVPFVCCTSVHQDV